MKKIISFVSILSIAAFIWSPVAYAAKTPSGAPVNMTGNDVSWPQCGKSLPTDHAFAVVGINGGTAANTNPCLAEQLVWANKATGRTSQPKLQLYVNTANPGEVIDQIQTWPSSNIDQTGFATTNPYGPCVSGANDLQCSWQYGWNRAVSAHIERFTPVANSLGIPSPASNYVWWLDVETMNTWQSGSTAALARNTATLEGMTAYFQSKQAKVGVYSTTYQWSVITGSSLPTSSNLIGLDTWVAGARNQKIAQSNCKATPFIKNSKIALSQYISNNLDYDVSCVN